MANKKQKKMNKIIAVSIVIALVLSSMTTLIGIFTSMM